MLFKSYLGDGLNGGHRVLHIFCAARGPIIFSATTEQPVKHGNQRSLVSAVKKLENYSGGDLGGMFLALCLQAHSAGRGDKDELFKSAAKWQKGRLLATWYFLLPHLQNLNFCSFGIKKF